MFRGIPPGASQGQNDAEDSPLCRGLINLNPTAMGDRNMFDD